MKRWWNGDLVLEMLVWKVGKAEYYSNVKVMPMSEGWLVYERTWLWPFRSTTAALEFPAFSIRLCNHGSLQFVACKLHRDQYMFTDLYWKKRTIHQLQTALSSERLRLRIFAIS